MKVKITTTIDKELRKQAILKDVVMAQALEIGVRASLGYNTEKTELLSLKANKEAELMAINARLNEIKEQEAKADIQKKLHVVKKFE